MNGCLLDGKAAGAFPADVIAARQLHLFGDFGNGFFDRAAEIALADAVLDGDVTLIAFAVDFGGSGGRFPAPLRKQEKSARKNGQ
jgi:hypothetical protein